MYKLCKSEQSALRQREIEDGLLEAMLTQRYEDISISDLCDRLAVPRKTFYRYFSSKDGCLHALLDHRLMEFERRDEKSTRLTKPRFDMDIHWFFEFWLRQKALLDALAYSGLSGILVERAIHNSQEAQIFENRKLSREYVQLSTVFAVCGMMTTVIQWHHDGYKQSPKEMAEMTCQMLSSPLVPNLNL